MVIVTGYVDESDRLTVYVQLPPRQDLDQLFERAETTGQER